MRLVTLRIETTIRAIGQKPLRVLAVLGFCLAGIVAAR